MKLEDLLENMAPWLTGDGPEADIVFSSRVRLARNIRGYNFPRRMSRENRRNLFAVIVAGIGRTASLPDPLIVKLEELSELNRQFLMERHLISRELSPEHQGGAAIGKNEIVSLMINEEDHLRIQVIRSGLSLARCWEEIDRIDTDLEKVLTFECSPEYGYLTACPSNVGTGMRASVMMHLPALVLSQQIGKIVQAVGKLGLAVRGLYGEGSPAAGNIFQISNQSTLGKSESEILGDLEKIIRKIIIHERNGRRVLLDGQLLRLQDRICRARGILENARLISSEETISLLSALRMGVDLGVLDSITRKTVNQVFIQSQPAHLQRLAGRVLAPEERDALRANLIREKLAGPPR
ncbi:MAG: protein arginine kinase [PVC group bacterium]